jgi:glycosidase
MTEDLLYWVEEVGVDGFRMDVAFLVPEDFWNPTIETLRAANPDLFLLAEAEESNLRNMEHPFTASYAWSFHHLMNRLAEQNDSLASIDAWLAENDAKFEQGYNMHFITNHDENSWNGTVQERLGEAANALAVLAFTLEGMPLIYSGQEQGLNKRLAFFEKDSIDWSDYALENLYSTLLDLKHRNSALWNGAAGGKAVRIPTNEDEHIYAFYREANDDRVLVLLNLSTETEVFQLNCEDCAGIYSDVFEGESLEISNDQEVSLGAWAYQVLEREESFEK